LVWTRGPTIVSGRPAPGLNYEYESEHSCAVAKGDCLLRGEHHQNHFLHAGDVHIDLAGRVVIHYNQYILLPARLFDLLTYLVRHQEVVLTREHLLEQVSGDGGTQTCWRALRRQTVDAHMYRLRG